MPLDNETGVLGVTTGYYTGNDTANRCIVHGLGHQPKMVTIIRQNLASSGHYLIMSYDGTIENFTNASDNNFDVTAATSFCFYVGNVANYPGSANANAVVYRWTAVG